MAAAPLTPSRGPPARPPPARAAQTCRARPPPARCWRSPPPCCSQPLGPRPPSTAPSTCPSAQPLRCASPATTNNRCAPQAPPPRARSLDVPVPAGAARSPVLPPHALAPLRLAAARAAGPRRPSRASPPRRANAAPTHLRSAWAACSAPASSRPPSTPRRAARSAASRRPCLAGVSAARSCAPTPALAARRLACVAMGVRGRASRGCERRHSQLRGHVLPQTPPCPPRLLAPTDDGCVGKMRQWVQKGATVSDTVVSGSTSSPLAQAIGRAQALALAPAPAVPGRVLAARPAPPPRPAARSAPSSVLARPRATRLAALATLPPPRPPPPPKRCPSQWLRPTRISPRRSSAPPWPSRPPSHVGACCRAGLWGAPASWRLSVGAACALIARPARFPPPARCTQANVRTHARAGTATHNHTPPPTPHTPPPHTHKQ